MKNKRLLIFAFIFVIQLLLVNVVKAAESYSIDYLIKNYNAVVLGTKDNNLISEYQDSIPSNPKGNIENLTVEGPALVRGNYEGKVNENIDFDKLYSKVMKESQMLVEQTQYYINDYDMSVNKPGIYTITNTTLNEEGNRNRVRTYNGVYYYMMQKNILIDNYDPNSYYVFNMLDDSSIVNYDIQINDPNNGSSYSVYGLIEDEEYTGNIILNFPNARYIRSNGHYVHIIAPKADVLLDSYYYNGRPTTVYTGTIVANSIAEPGTNTLYKANSTLSKKLLSEKADEYVVETKDYTDDIYYGDYSIVSMLRNYNIVALGQKAYQSNAKLKTLDHAKGSVGVFHIAGQFLIKGDLGVEDYDYPGYVEIWDEKEYGYMRLDLEKNETGESHLGGSIKSPYYLKFWNTETSIYGSKNDFYHKGNSFDRAFSEWSSEYKHNGYVQIPDNYINYQRLYNNIVAEQNSIKEGTVVTAKDGVVHVKTGGTYTIEDVTGISEIVIDDFANNKTKLTVINIKNSGSINFPKISKDKGNKAIVTNDYYGKTKATQSYELENGLITDDYHGNIVFNVPNANYIKLASNAPFAGHLIAPNADVETEETQIAGAMIVNSFYAEGGTELHFYPLTLYEECDCEGYDDLTEQQKTTFRKILTARELGGEGTIIEEAVLGDTKVYNNDLEKFNEILASCFTAVNTSKEESKNPETIGSISAIIVLIAIISGGAAVLINKKQKGNT